MNAEMISSLGFDKMSPTGLAVVVTLVLLSIWTLTVSVERLIAFRRGAIPAAWMFNLLTERLDRLRVEMESSSAELMDFFLELEGALPERA